MERIYKHLSDDTLKELCVAIKRAQDELMSKAPKMGAYEWYTSYLYGSSQLDVESGAWAEMDERGLLDDDNDVVS